MRAHNITYCCLNIFWVAHDIKQVASTKGVSKGIFKWAKMMVHFADNKSSKFTLRKTFVFMENFSEEKKWDNLKIVV